MANLITLLLEHMTSQLVSQTKVFTFTKHSLKCDTFLEVPWVVLEQEKYLIRLEVFILPLEVDLMHILISAGRRVDLFCELT